MSGKTDGASTAQKSSASTANAAIDEQKKMNAESLRLNIAMGWLQMAMSMTSKISGR